MSNETTIEKSAVSTQGGRRWWLFTACVLVSLTNEVSTAVTNLSLGPMRRDLGASSAVMQIAVTLGKLMLGAFMLAGGVAGDVYGRRRVLVLGALGMVGASLLAAIAQTGAMLLVARALDGLASAAIAPMALALISSGFSQAEQARVIGLFLGLSGLGAALGPLGAGLVVQAQGWRAGFLVPAAVAALGGLGVFLFASGDRPKSEGRRLDGIGRSLVLLVCLGWYSGSFRSTKWACFIPGCCNPSPWASAPFWPLSGGNAGPGIHYWTSRCFTIARSLWPSRPDYWPRWSWAEPFCRCSTSCKPCKR